jgi:multidrug resistance efflux pump
MRMPDVESRFEPQGAVLVSTTPERLGQILKDDVQRYAPLFKQDLVATQAIDRVGNAGRKLAASAARAHR